MANRHPARRLREDPFRLQALGPSALGHGRDRSLYRQRVQTAEGGIEGRANMSPPNHDRKARQQEGERRKDAAHSLLEARREVNIRRARRALLLQLLETGNATADEVAERIGPAPDGIDGRFLGAVPGMLARAKIIRRTGFVASSRPSRHASFISTWVLADRAGAIAWLARNPELPEPEPDDAGAPSPTTSKPPSPAPLAVALHQTSLF